MSAKELVAELEKLDESALAKFVEELQKHHDLAEDLYDLLAFRMRADEPSRPFEEFIRGLPQKGWPWRTSSSSTVPPRKRSLTCLQKVCVKSKSHAIHTPMPSQQYSSSRPNPDYSRCA